MRGPTHRKLITKKARHRRQLYQATGSHPKRENERLRERGREKGRVKDQTRREQVHKVKYKIDRQTARKR